MMDKIIQALTTAYKKDHEGVENVIVDVDEVRKDLRMYVQKEIVEEVENPGSQMSLEEARAKFGRVVDPPRGSGGIPPGQRPLPPLGRGF